LPAIVAVLPFEHAFLALLCGAAALAAGAASAITMPATSAPVRPDPIRR
jgi:hypothetical protein